MRARILGLRVDFRRAGKFELLVPTLYLLLHVTPGCQPNLRERNLGMLRSVPKQSRMMGGIDEFASAPSCTYSGVDS
jgi:hypothetical protein